MLDTESVIVRFLFPERKTNKVKHDNWEKLLKRNVKS